MKDIVNIENISEGFKKFYNQHKRLPTASEIDTLSYLPSSRYIQKRHGGLEKLRAQLGYADTHFGKGNFRSTIATRVGKRGRVSERELEIKLQSKFGEVFVHSEKMFDHSKNRVDFYVYSPDGNFGIDIFQTDNLRSLQSNVNIKMKKYINFALPLYFVNNNDSINQSDLDLFVKSKIKPLPKFITLITSQTLDTILQSKKAYPNPLNKK